MPLDPEDYLDYGECTGWGEAPEPEPPRECSGCGKACDSTVWLDTWAFFACPECRELTEAVERAEQLCPVLHDRVIEAESVEEVRKLMREHQCASCLPVRRGVKPEGERGTGQERAA